MTAESLSMAREDVEALLPWRAAGTLDEAARRCIDGHLQRDPHLAAVLRDVHDEMSQTVIAHEALGGPSPLALGRLMGAIDAEPRRAASAHRWVHRVTAFVAGLSPRTLLCAASVASLAILVQGGVIGSLLLSAPYRPGLESRAAMPSPLAEPSSGEVTAPAAPVTRSLGAEAAENSGVRLQIRFSADARMVDVAQFMAANAASIVGGPRGGAFTVRFGRSAMSKSDVVALVKALERERIVEAISIAQ